ncbi:MAG: FecR family protein [Chlorobi bacterium]|nr:FecR family protein [Chlorobiota bacterium]
MAAKKEHNYSIEELTQDKKFISWVKDGLNPEDWQQFIKENPHKRKDIETARKIINLLKTSESPIAEGEVYAVWKNINLFYSLYHKKQRNTVLKRMLRYAAVFIIALSIGVTIPYFYSQLGNRQFSELNISDSDSYLGAAKIILSDGEQVVLTEKESSLLFNPDGAGVKINNDSIVKQHYDRNSTEVQPIQIIMPFGKKSNLQLPDGTVVWLNAGSKLVFPPTFKGKHRRVYLKGEAFFKVAKNKQKPFVVSTNDININVFGTEFNIRANSSDNEIEVVLVEGEISLKENNILSLLGKEIRLKPRQRAVYNRNNNTTDVTSNVDVDYYTSWTKGLLEFRQESIVNVFRRLSRFYNIKFVAERSVELNKKISGKLDLKESLEDVLKVISDAVPITYKIEDDKVFVYGKLNYLPMRK